MLERPEVPLDVNHQTPDDFKLLFSEKASARVLSLSLRTIQKLVANGELRARRVGRRVLIHRKELEAFARKDHYRHGGQ